MEKMRRSSSSTTHTHVSNYQNIPPDFVLGGGGGGVFVDEMGLDPHVYYHHLLSTSRQEDIIIPPPPPPTSSRAAGATTSRAAANMVVMYADSSRDMLFSNSAGNVVGESSSNNARFGPNPEDVFGFNSPTMSDDPNSNSMLNSLSTGFEEGELIGGKEDQNEGEHSSAFTAAAAAANPHSSSSSSKKGKADRSRTLVSERKRRGRMKEKLYALRALVPNITKMDKASIVGDAMLYVQGLQMQAKTLKAEIAGLESSKCRAAVSIDVPLLRTTRSSPQTTAAGPCPSSLHPAVRVRMIMQIDVIQVEERGYYVKVVSNKGQGVAVSLYRGLESLAANYYLVLSSNLTSAADRYILTFTLHAGECAEHIDMQNLKLWITRALLNQGFEFQSS